MKKLLLAVSVAAFASVAQAELLTITLSGDVKLTKTDDANYGYGSVATAFKKIEITKSFSEFSSKQVGDVVQNQGTYNTETGQVTFGNFSMLNKQYVPSAAPAGADAAEITVYGNYNVNLKTLTGTSIIDYCEDNVDGLGCTGAGYDRTKIQYNVPGYVVEERTLKSVELVGAVDLSNPGTFSFVTELYDAKQGVTVTTTYTAVVSPATTSEVPVPAAAWLFGSALAGLAGLRKRK